MTISNPLPDNSPDHEDQSLVLRARSGDRQALEDLVHRHQAWIYNIAVRMLHHPQDAEELAPLLNELIYRPFATLDRYQDKHLIENAEVVPVHLDRGDMHERTNYDS